MSKLKIGIIGATGVVGVEVVSCLFEYGFRDSTIIPMASRRSAGTSLQTPFGELVVKEFSPETCKSLDVVFLCVGGDFSKQYARELSKYSVVIDNSSAFRQETDVPLVIPQINPGDIGSASLIANPNCTTAIIAMALHPLHRRFNVKTLIASTYQAVSGSGKEAMDELILQTKQIADGDQPDPKAFPVQIVQNLIPRIDTMQPNGYTREEIKLVRETHKIFHNDNIAISSTSVRVPTLRAHAAACSIETEKPIDVQAARDVLEAAEGVQIVDEPETYNLPMPLSASEQYDVQVGRLRSSSVFGNHGLDFFVCGDQLLRGAALNAVEIAKVRFKVS